MTTNVTGHVESWAGPTARYPSNAFNTNYSFVTTPTKNAKGSCRLNVTGGVAALQPGSPPAGDDYWSFYFRFVTLPATDIRLAWWGEVSGLDNDRGLSFNSATGKLRVFAHSTFDETGLDGGPVLVTGTWYLIDMAFFGSTREFKWRMATEDEDPPTDQTTFVWDAGHSGGAIGQSNFGNARGPTGTFDLYIGASVETANLSTRTPIYPIGHHACVLLNPAGEGTHVNSGHFTDDAANSPPVNPHTRIDDDPKTTTDTDWNKQTTLDVTSYLEYTIDDLPAEAVSVLTVLVGDGYAAEDASSTSRRKIHWVMDAVDRNLTGTGIVLPAAGVKTWDKNLGNASYTPDPSLSGVNAMKLRHGYDDDISPNLRIRDLWVEVAYKVSPGPEAYWGIALV